MFLRRNLTVAMLGAAILAVSAYLLGSHPSYITLPTGTQGGPAKSARNQAVPNFKEAGRFNVVAILKTNPPVVGNNELDLTVTDHSGKPANGLKLKAEVVMTGMGSDYPKVTAGKEGRYSLSAPFTMDGPWTVKITGGAAGKIVNASMDFYVGGNTRWEQVSR